ncbi:hypothetical protein Bxe_B0904 [Paraburkholderia xenovorans LB400]|uniref:Uncharacterized protein n=1 Tax=Paraburkholderia xenovorans (strain LB400) TaxID=266265 RepID=Q13LI9_PARXL|nr:hypothetical protein Bxe_B0904 [Paraburkholderia xenovorans LB400]
MRTWRNDAKIAGAVISLTVFTDARRLPIPLFSALYREPDSGAQSLPMLRSAAATDFSGCSCRRDIWRQAHHGRHAHSLIRKGQ